MKIKTNKDLKTGDLVQVDVMTLDGEYKWTGMCNWNDGYKFSFVVLSDTDAQYKPNDEIVWTIHDLKIAEAEVLSESR